MHTRTLCVQDVGCVHTWTLCVQDVGCVHTRTLCVQDVGCVHTWTLCVQDVGCVHLEAVHYRIGTLGVHVCVCDCVCTCVCVYMCVCVFVCGGAGCSMMCALKEAAMSGGDLARKIAMVSRVTHACR